MKYGIEKLCRTHTGQAWRRVGTSEGTKYVYCDRKEAERSLGLFYDADPTIIRIIELPGDF